LIQFFCYLSFYKNNNTFLKKCNLLKFNNCKSKNNLKFYDYENFLNLYINSFFILFFLLLKFWSFMRIYHLRVIESTEWTSLSIFSDFKKVIKSFFGIIKFDKEDNKVKSVNDSEKVYLGFSNRIELWYFRIDLLFCSKIK
jgi:hypothetical protein